MLYNMGDWIVPNSRSSGLKSGIIMGTDIYIESFIPIISYMVRFPNSTFDIPITEDFIKANFTKVNDPVLPSGWINYIPADKLTISGKDIFPETSDKQNEPIEKLWESYTVCQSYGHNWVTYQGFNQSFEYCKVCDAKKDEK